MADDTDIGRLKEIALSNAWPEAFAAMRDLGRIGGESAVSILVRFLSHTDHVRRWVAAEALGDTGNRAAVPALIKALSSSIDTDDGIPIVDALGKLGDTAAVPVLSKALSSHHPEVRARAAGALGKLGDASAIPSLIRALKDENYGVKRNASAALIKIGDSAALPALVEVLQDPGIDSINNGWDHDLLYCVQSAIVKLGDESTVASLMEIYSRSNAPRNHIRTVLIDLGEKLGIRELNERYFFDLDRKLNRTQLPPRGSQTRLEDTALAQQWYEAHKSGSPGTGCLLPLLTFLTLFGFAIALSIHLLFP